MNDYKKDADKAPVLDALLPFYPALEALARMMVDSAVRHKIEGADDPFNQWRQLPDAKKRLANAAGRHILKGPWTLDPESGHLHATHALFGILSALTLHQEAKPAGTSHGIMPICGSRANGGICTKAPGHEGHCLNGAFADVSPHQMRQLMP